MEATIGLEDLAIDCIIGARDSERAAARRILVDVTLEADIATAVASDELADALDYSAVSRLLIAVAQEQAFRLLERFAATAASRLLEAFPAARAVVVTVKKPGVAGAARAFVRLRRERL